MPTIRIEHKKNFTTIHNLVLRDSRLSLRARGLHHLLLSYPDNWKINIRQLQDVCQEGRDAIMKALQELESCGYLVREKHKNPKNGCFEWEQVLRELPINGFSEHGGKCSYLPSTENPEYGKSGDIRNIYEEQSKEENNKHETETSAPLIAARSRDRQQNSELFEPEFEQDKNQGKDDGDSVPCPVKKKESGKGKKSSGQGQRSAANVRNSPQIRYEIEDAARSQVRYKLKRNSFGWLQMPKDTKTKNWARPRFVAVRRLQLQIAMEYSNVKFATDEQGERIYSRNDRGHLQAALDFGGDILSEEQAFKKGGEFDLADIRSDVHTKNMIPQDVYNEMLERIFEDSVRFCLECGADFDKVLQRSAIVDLFFAKDQALLNAATDAITQSPF